MLTRLYVNNYRCFVNFEFRPSRKQLILGRNGSGKSTVLEVLALLRDFSVRGDSCFDRFGGNTKSRFLAGNPGAEKQTFELDVSLGGSLFKYRLEVAEEITGEFPAVLEESVHCDDDLVFLFRFGEVHLFNEDRVEQVKYPFDAHRSALATVQDERGNTQLAHFNSWLERLTQVQMNPWVMTSRSEMEAAILTRNFSNFADWYRHLLLDKGSAVYRAIAELKQVLPGLDSLDAKEAGQNVRLLQASVRSDRSKKPRHFSFDELSEGQKVLIALYLLNYCAITPDSTLLIDEPDNFIALAEIQPWLMNLLDRVDEENAQVIIASHHPELLNQLAGQGGIIFDRPEGLHTRVREFSPSDDSGLPPAELVARGWEGA